MEITRHTLVNELLHSHPDARDILNWYGIDLDGRNLRMDLDELSDCYEMDLKDLLAELKTMFDDYALPISDDDDDDDDNDYYFDDD